MFRRQRTIGVELIKLTDEHETRLEYLQRQIKDLEDEHRLKKEKMDKSLNLLEKTKKEEMIVKFEEEQTKLKYNRDAIKVEINKLTKELAELKEWMTCLRTKEESVKFRCTNDVIVEYKVSLLNSLMKNMFDDNLLDKIINKAEYTGEEIDVYMPLDIFKKVINALVINSCLHLTRAELLDHGAAIKKFGFPMKKVITPFSERDSSMKHLKSLKINTPIVTSDISWASNTEEWNKIKETDNLRGTLIRIYYDGSFRVKIKVNDIYIERFLETYEWIKINGQMLCSEEIREQAYMKWLLNDKHYDDVVV